VTIGESDSFTERGGMIGLIVDQGRVRFDINLAAITAAHLQVSSKLLALGRTVKK
jgi:YfiR/HmsC-like